MTMTPRNDGIDQKLEERNRRFSSDFERVNDEELENEELTEADFDIDDDEDEEEERLN